MKIGAVPPSTARVNLEKAGAALVDKQLVSAKQLRRIFGSGTITADERRVARKIIRRAQDEIATGGLSWGEARDAKRAVKELAAAVAVETSLARRIEDARLAFEGGLIDDQTYRAVTSEHPGLRARIAVWVAAREVPADGRAPSSRPSSSRKAAEARAALERLASGLSNRLVRFARDERSWGLATFTALVVTAVVAPGVTAGLLLGEAVAGIVAGGAAKTALEDAPDR